MTTNFPGTSIDSFPTHATGDVIEASYDNNEQDAIVALETKVGVDGSAVNTTHDYKLGEVTSGDKAAGKTATQTLTNKTLTAPVITSPTINLTSDAEGDTYYRNSSGAFVRLARGTDNYIYKMNGNVPNWEAEASIANASTTVVGISELATAAEITAGTATGGTGAALVVTPDALASSIPVFNGSGLTNVTGLNILLTASNNLKYSADTERTQTTTNTYTIKKQITIRQRGTIRVKFDLKGSDTTYQFYGRIYVNGIAVGTERLQQGAGATTYVTYSEDITIAPYDLVQLYIKNESTGGLTTYCRNFQIYYDVSNPVNGTVDTD